MKVVTKELDDVPVHILRVVVVVVLVVMSTPNLSVVLPDVKEQEIVLSILYAVCPLYPVALNSCCVCKALLYLITFILSILNTMPFEYIYPLTLIFPDPQEELFIKLLSVLKIQI
jgi:hypothetical protein